MERLKSVLADKIIEVSSEMGDSSKSNLEKLNRFRDFSFACEALMKKYPQIEDELIRMIESNDFDTRIASSRVNNIISVLESGGTFSLNTVTPKADDEKEDFHANGLLADVVEDSLTAVIPEESDEVEATENLNFTATFSQRITSDPVDENKTKANLKRILIVASVIVGILAAYFAIKFIIANWETILIVLGLIGALGGLFWFMANKKSDSE